MACENRRFAKQPTPSCPVSSRRPKTHRPRWFVERLEDRLMLTTVSWNGDSDGFWDVATNWLDDMGVQRVPGMDDDVVINRGAANPTITVRSGSQLVKSLDARESLVLEGGSLAVSVASQIASDFTFSGGTLDADGPLTLAGGATWTGGVLSGSATTSNTGTMSITTGTATVNASTLENAGTVIQTGGELVLTGATFTNLASGLIDIRGDVGVSGAGGSLRNIGMLKKSAGAGTSTVAVAIDNTGTVEVDSGTLALTGAITQHVGSTLTGGTWNVGTGSNLSFATGSNITTNQASVTLSGAGSTFAKINALATNSGTFSLQAGRDFTTAGALMNSGVLVVGDNSDLTPGAFAILTNTGVVRKSAGPGDTIVTRVATSGGMIDVQSGTLRLPNSSGAGGTVEVTAGAVLDLTAGTSVTYAGNFTGSGAGDVLLTGGVLTVGSGGASFDLPNGRLLWPDGQIDARAAELNINSAVRLTTAAQRVLRGRVTASGSFLMAGGSLVGGGDAGAALALQGVSEWSDGQIVLFGGVANTGTLTLSGPDTKALNGTNLTNSGVIVHAGSGALDLGDNTSSVTNEAGALYDLQGDASVTAFNTSIVNAGTIRKSAGNGTSILEAPTNTGGTIEVRAGTLVLASNGSGAAGPHTGGIFNVAAGATLDLTGGRLARFQGIYTGSGAGTIQFESGEIFATGFVTLDFPGPLFQWTGGFFHAGQVANRGTMTLSGPGAKTMDQTSLDNAGTIIHSGTGNLDVASGNQELANLPGATYEIRGDAAVTVFGGSQFTNQGTLRKSSGSGASLIEHLVNQGGTIQVDAGSITLDGAGFPPSTGGTFTVAAGAILDLVSTNSISLYQGTYNGAGAGVVRLRGGTLSVGSAPAGATASATFNITGGGLIWEDGSITASAGGDSAFINQGLLTLAGPAVKTLSANSNFTLINQGTVRHETGTLDLSNNSMRVDNQAGATYDLLGDADITMFGAATFTNAGTFRKSAGVGTANLGASPTSGTLDNTGVVEVLSGTLNVGAVVSQVSGSTLTGGTWIIADATLALPNAGNLTINQGNITLDGPSSVFTNIANLASSSGSFSLLGGRDFTTASNFTNSGVATVGAESELHVAGNYTQASTLAIGIAGPPASDRFGRLTVSGTATLDGIFRAEFDPADAYSPQVGDAFQVATFASRAGDFDSFEGLDFGGITFFQPALSATDLKLSIVSDAADLVVQDIDVPATGIAGQDVTITYTVRNHGTPTTIARWIDSIYLSTDGVLDAADKLIGRVEHVGAVAGLASYTDSLTAPLPGVLEGEYRVLVLADTRRLAPDTNRANNTGVSADRVAVDIPLLTVGETVSGTIANNEDAYFRLAVQPGRSVLLTANFTAATQADLSVGFEQVPDRSQFDQLAAGMVDLEQQLTVGIPGGRYYILLHGREGAAGGKAFTLKAEEEPFFLQSVGLDRGANAGTATIPLVGSGFIPNTQASLIGADGVSHSAQDILFTSSRQLFATFNLTGLPLGTYDVQLTQQGESQTLADAFQVVTGEPGQLQTDVVVPALVRVGRPFTGVVEYRNTGDTDLVAPILILSTPAQVALRLGSSDAFASGDLILVAASSDGPAGILRPGEEGRIEFSAVLTNADPAPFDLSFKPADATDLIDYDAVQQEIKPPGIADAEWNPIYDRFREEAGPTWGGLVRIMARFATQLGQQETRTFSARDVIEAALFDGFLRQRGSVFGNVFLENTDHPIAGDTLALTNADVTQGGFAQSRADGSFVFADMPPGTYDLAIDGFLLRGNVQVTVPNMAPPPEIALIVAEGGTIEGNVTEIGNRNPLTGVSVVAVNESGGAFFATSDVNGDFQLRGLADGQYTVTATQTTLSTQGQTVTLVTDTDRVRLDFELERAATVRGTVRRADDDTAVVGATVTILDSGGNAFAAVTDASGGFSLTGLASGAASLRVEASGFAPVHLPGFPIVAGVSNSVDTIRLDLVASLSVHVVDASSAPIVAHVSLRQNGVLFATDATELSADAVLEAAPGVYELDIRSPGFFSATQNFVLAAGEHAVRDITMQSGGVVEGFVRDGGGSPLSDVPVSVVSPDGAAINVSTLADGSYRFISLGAGQFAISVGIPPGIERQDFTLDVATPVRTIDFSVPGVSLRGFVFDVDGATPATNVAVVLGQNGESLVTDFTDSAGFYKFVGVSPGSYEIAAAGPTGLTPAAMLMVGADNLDVPPLQIGTLMAEVRVQSDAGDPVENAFVSLTSRTTPSISFNVTPASVANATSSFQGLAPGEYEIQVVVPGFPLQRFPLILDATTPTTVVEIRSGHTIAGHVTASDTGEAIAGALIRILEASGVIVVALALSDSNGNYSVANLPDGAFDIFVSAAGRQVQEAAGVTINGAATTQDVAMFPQTTELRGSVVDNQGRPVARADVAIRNNRGQVVATIASDFAGAFATSELAPGTYTVFARSDGFHSGISDLATVAAGPTTQGVAVTLAPAGADAGVVNDEFAAFLNSFGDFLMKTFAEDLNPTPMRDGRDFDPSFLASADQLADCPELFALIKRGLDARDEKERKFQDLEAKHSEINSEIARSGSIFLLQFAKLAGSIASLQFAAAKLATNAALNAPGQLAQSLVGAGAAVTRAAKLAEILTRASSVYDKVISTYQTGIDGLPPLDLTDKKSVVDRVNTIVGLGADIASVSAEGITIVQLIRAAEELKEIPGVGKVLPFIDVLVDTVSLISGTIDSVQAFQNAQKSAEVSKQNYLTAVDNLRREFEKFRKAKIDCDQRRRLKVPAAPRPDNPQPGDTATTTGVRATDPNDIAGPAGFGAAGFIAPDLVLPYTIHFENLAAATAAAQAVTITHRLDSDLDPATFELGDVGFGNLVVDVPDGRSFFSTRIDVRGTLGLFVDVTAGLNTTTGEATWTFTSIDPDTLDITADPLAGFLPPNQTSPEGEGFVSYIVRPKAGLTTGTEIRAMAEIVFDANDPITTNQIDPQDPSKGTDLNKEALVTIDAGPPTSSVNPLPAVTNAASFTVIWSGTDDASGPAGAGVAVFDVFVSDNSGPFTPFRLGTSNTSALFTGNFDHTYSFFAVATDNVGHQQPTPATAQASTTLMEPPAATNGPRVVDLRLPTDRRNVTAIVPVFDKELNRAEAERLANYELLSPGKDRRFGTRDDKVPTLRSAVYDRIANTVTLTPRKRLRTNQAIRLTIQDTVTDLAGNRLDGDADGQAGGDFIGNGGAWTRIAYTDDDGDRVVLQLDLRGVNGTVVDQLLDGTAAGLMEVTWGPTITGRRLRLIDTLHGETVLRGAVQPGRGGDGQTVLESITGLAGVRNRLPSSFVVGTIASAVDEVLAGGVF